MTSAFRHTLLGLAAAGALAAPARAFEVAEVRGDFYYDSHDRLVAMKHVEVDETRAREPRSMRDKLAEAGIRLPAARTSLRSRTPHDKPVSAPLYDNSLPHRIVVKFRDDQPVRLRNGALSSFGRSAAPAAQSVLAAFPEARVERLFTTDEAILDSDRDTGQLLSGEELADLNNYYRIVLPEGADGRAVADAFLALAEVETLYFETVPVAPPACVDVAPATPDWEANQLYLDPAPTGMDVEYAWAYHAGGDGNPGFWITDVEYAWCYDHEDYNADTGDVLTGIATGIYETPDHGQAVLSIIGSCDNGYGMTGIANDVTLKMADVDVAGIGSAITTAQASLLPGEIILLEQQVGGPSGELLPVEWVQSIYDAIATAVANGLVVVEAAGNGGVNLDSSAYGGLFNPAVRNSGAILVGAGDLNNNVMSFSNYGARVDMHAHGTSVYAAGYGSIWSGSGCTQNYTSGFNGTSSASALITGAAASLQGIANGKYSFDLSPYQIRSSLKVGGTPQGTPTSNNIGPMPNLVYAINEMEPDMLPATPTGWTAPVVPRATADASVGSALLGSAALPGNTTTYFNWSDMNNPVAWSAALNGPDTGSSVSGIPQWIGLGANPAPGGRNYWVNWPVDVKGGRHALKVVSDYSGVEDEWIETNNTYTVGAVWSGLVLPENTAFYRTYDPAALADYVGWYNAEGFQLNPTGGYWHVAAVMPTSATDDFDIRLNTETPSNIPLAGFGANVKSSFTAAGDVAWVGWDRNEVGNATHYASVLNFAGTGQKVVEFDGDDGTLFENTTTGPFTIAASQLVEIHELYLASGQSYRVHLTVLSGSADIGLSVIDGTTGYFSTSNALVTVDAAGAGQDEWVVITPAATDYYGLVVWKPHTADLLQSTSYDVTITTTPNLVGSSTPSSWDHPIVPRNDGGATFLADLPATLNSGTNSTYFNFSTYNQGANAVTGSWQTWLYQDGQYLDFFSASALNQGAYWVSMNQGPYSVSGGRHHLQTVADVGGQIAEFDETDNSFTEWFVWDPEVLVPDVTTAESAPPFAAPPGWGPWYGAAGYRAASSSFWTAVAVTPSGSGTDYDLRVHDAVSTGSRDGFGPTLKGSYQGAGRTEYVLVNHNVVPGGSYDFGVLDFIGDPQGFEIAQDNAPLSLDLFSSGALLSGLTLGTDDLIDVHEFYVNTSATGIPFYISLNVQGAVDLDFALFDGTVGLHSPTTTLLAAANVGTGMDEHLAPITFTAPGYHALAVFRRGAAELGRDAPYEIRFSAGGSATDTPELSNLPADFSLAAPRPNPVRNVAAIGFDVPANAGDVRVSVYDLTGRRVATLADGARAAGRHSVDWDGRDAGGRKVSAGIYFVRLESPGHRESRKITVLR